MQDVTAIREAENQIRQLNEELEQRVAERTAELVTINEETEKNIKNDRNNYSKSCFDSGNYRGLVH